MTNECSSVNSSNQDFINLKNIYEEALKSYNSAINDYQNTNNKIQDSECVIKGLPIYINKTIDFCNYNSLSQYNINIQMIPDSYPSLTSSRMYDSIIQNERYCKFGEDYTQLFCNSNCFQWSCARFCDNEDCSDKDCKSRMVSRSCYYDRKTYTFNHYGIFIKGSSNVELQCGQYSHSISVKTSEYLASSITTPKTFFNGRIVEENINKYYASTLHFESKTPDLNKIDKQIPTSSGDINFLMNDVYQFIKQQCSLYSIKNINYEEIKQKSIESIPELENIIKQKKENLDAKKENMDSQKMINDKFNYICNKSYELWLPLIFVIPLFMCCFLCFLEEEEIEENKRIKKKEQKENRENRERGEIENV